MAGAGRIGRRLVNLYVGLGLLGASSAWMVEAHLGLMPWDVLHEGVADRTGLSYGSVVIAVGVLVMMLWIPLRQAPGIGTISNAILVGLSADATLYLLPTPRTLPVRATLLVVGVAGNAVATALYIGARLGPGPRDGVMTGLSQRRRLSVRLVRTGIEVTALIVGLILGGTAGVGTVLYAACAGPIIHHFLPRLTVATPTAVAVDPLDDITPDPAPEVC
jgi:uncharacterized membrane protein YczE